MKFHNIVSKVRHTVYVFSSGIAHNLSKNRGQFNLFQEPTVFTIHTLFIVMMLNSSTSINKTSNHLSHQLVIERKKRDQEIWRWKPMPCVGTDTQMWRC